jgi:NAD(P)-dependent dehydrogenase (short-subunit alcohol dehydrogenase family)
MITSDSFRLDGKVAVVTGSGRNIGRSIAESFAALGAKVVVNGHSDVEAINSVASGIRERGARPSRSRQMSRATNRSHPSSMAPCRLSAASTFSFRMLV